ncbi:MAG: BrnT family toxin [Oscillospiraceae bacterium]|nr:BrnT family toxin [Oscillospiraceae bacterium]
MYEYFDFDVNKTEFEWDDEKERINFTKHGIHFKTAAKVFFDPYKMIHEDKEHPEEERYDILGKVGRVLFVVCTFRHENTVRLISARIATAAEKWRHEHGEDEYE